MDINGDTHILTPGQGFIVNIPGNYRYYLPDDSNRWEFMYITLYGDVVKHYWNEIQKDIGYILHFQPDSEPVTYLLKLLQSATAKEISNAHQASGLAYQFTMNLVTYCTSLEKRLSQWPEEIVEASMFANNHYGEDIGPDDMAIASGMSRYHFTRQFKHYTNATPIQYLTDIRIKKAKELLLNTKYSAEDIAKLTGYKNANYFNKVFKKVTGTSPGKFRTEGQPSPPMGT
ncbi:AraC family transcriptional regulator [Pontibacillus halophilus JSM 076056 = DSM 19796]|uniref:AraC family transcriptional regulator n=1 Tax=Pontibacillus halophilus JSM 076056 = DSM 19796 TaxID=1385510 RepID=A0A0A5I743_9BACI|nr:AraC family transcriptional regulator [Pontibacillus halophilus JSM 076056 = DSM 19796]